MDTSDRSNITGIEHVEIYVSNCHQAAHYYRTALGFTVLGEVRFPDQPADRVSIAVRQGGIRLLLTAPVTPACEVAEHIHVHGEGIRDIAFSVTDAGAVFDRAVAWGARPLQAPAVRQAGAARVTVGRIEGSGGLVHSLIEPAPNAEWPAADIVAPRMKRTTRCAGLVAIDHVAMALPAGTVDRSVAFYVGALGFRETHQEDVRTEYSAMRSKVVQTADGAVRFPLMEPAEGLRRSQIENYIDSHGGPGAQHLALLSADIVRSVSRLSGSIEFLPTPPTYYDSLEARVGALAGELAELRRYGILVDRDATGVLLQVFTKPIGARATLFLELIERRGAQGFGGGNIKALFEAVERAEAATAARLA